MVPLIARLWGGGVLETIGFKEFCVPGACTARPWARPPAVHGAGVRSGAAWQGGGSPSPAHGGCHPGRCREGSFLPIGWRATAGDSGGQVIDGGNGSRVAVLVGAP